MQASRFFFLGFSSCSSLDAYFFRGFPSHRYSIFSLPLFSPPPPIPNYPDNTHPGSISFVYPPIWNHLTYIYTSLHPLSFRLLSFAFARISSRGWDGVEQQLKRMYKIDIEPVLPRRSPGQAIFGCELQNVARSDQSYSRRGVSDVP